MTHPILGQLEVCHLILYCLFGFFVVNLSIVSVVFRATTMLVLLEYRMWVPVKSNFFDPKNIQGRSEYHTLPDSVNQTSFEYIPETLESNHDDARIVRNSRHK